MYSKGTELPDAPITDSSTVEQPASMLFCNGPRMHEFLREMNEKVLSKYDTMTVGELPHTPDPAHVLKYIGSKDKQLDMVFQFDIVDIAHGSPNKYESVPWKLSDLKSVLTKWQQFIAGTDAWTTVFCENHDQGRSVSRFGNDSPEWRVRSAKLLALLMCTLSGTLFIYQGQEIGMINAPRDWPFEDYKDIEAINFYNAVKATGDEARLQHVMKSIQLLGRDHARLPMQWDSSAHGGFTERSEGAWMRTHDLSQDINVKAQIGEDSVLEFWKRALKLRKDHKEAFIYGEFIPYTSDEHIFVFGKKQTGGSGAAYVVCNPISGSKLCWNSRTL